MTEYAIWGTKNGKEDIVRVNGMEVQTDFKIASKIRKILVKRNEFDRIRIQIINTSNFNLKSAFTKGLKRKRFI